MGITSQTDQPLSGGASFRCGVVTIVSF